MAVRNDFQFRQGLRGEETTNKRHKKYPMIIRTTYALIQMCTNPERLGGTRLSPPSYVDNLATKPPCNF